MDVRGTRIFPSVFGLFLCAPAAAQVTQRVSVGIGDTEANNFSVYASISGDGRYVAFFSAASNLIPGGRVGLINDFVYDRQTGVCEEVDVTSAGVPAAGNSSAPAISADGRFVAFVSGAANLVPGDTNGVADAFVHDRQLGTTERVSVDSSGIQGNHPSWTTAISSDGRYVAFASDASNLVPGDTNGQMDIFVRDRQTGTTERVSVATGGAESHPPSADAQYCISISGDGRYVAFVSEAPDLVPGDTNGADIFVHDRQNNTTERVNVDSSGGQANGASFDSFVSISADGRYVAFQSIATNLVAGDVNGHMDVFVHDRQSGATELVSVDSNGGQANQDSLGAVLSADGRFVAFTSVATNLVAEDTNGVKDVFLRDRQLGTTERLSVGSTGVEGNGASEYPAISADGSFVAFESDANNLIHREVLGFRDVFVRDRFGGPNFASLCDPGVAGVLACPCSNAPSGSGRGCDNSAATGGASLSAAGGTYLSSDSLVFTTSGEKPTATSIVLQGTTLVAGGATYGQGIRCVGGTLKRLFTKMASGGSITAPNAGAGESAVSVRSAAKGSPISAGQTRYYLVFYRDPTVLGGCPAGSTFNATQTGVVTWAP